MFLRHVAVRNFRGIAHLDLDLDETSILIGENSVGKTSLLELLDICLGHSNGEALGFCPARGPPDRVDP